jgi:RNA polymerase sigma-70 factor (ECF subfamily)
VLTIARNLSIDALRARRSVPIDPDDLVGLGLLSNDRDPAEVAISNDAASEIRAALSTLPVEQRRALVLAGLYGHTAAEVSVAEGIPLGTAKTRIRSGMLKLRAAMATKESLR